MKEYKFWTNNEIEYLINNYSDKSNRQLIKDLNNTRSIDSIEAKANRLKLKKSQEYMKVYNNGINLNEKNGMWKGDNVTLSAIHTWINSRKPKPQFCENCKKNKPCDLANISQEYHRDVNDFKWLCRKCHMEEDGRINTLHKMKKRKINGDMLFCSKCDKFLRKSEFWKNNWRVEGYNLYCKDCMKKYNKNWKLKKTGYKIEIEDEKER